MEWQPDDLTARRAAKAKAKKAGHEWTETEEENWEPAKDHGPLFEMKFHRVIIDEARQSFYVF